MAKKEPNSIDKYVGSRIRMRRLMLSMSQSDLGDALGITFQQIQKYEKGTNRVGASRLQAMASVLQVPAAFFFEGAPNGQKAKSKLVEEFVSPSLASDFLATTDGLALTKAFMSIASPKLRRRIVELVQQMASDVSKTHDRTVSRPKGQLSPIPSR